MRVEKWKPINFMGSWHHDPRDELRHRAKLAERQNDSYVAIPIALARACADVRECDATTVITGDEDGPLRIPITTRCKMLNGHEGEYHFNGAVVWKKESHATT